MLKKTTKTESKEKGKMVYTVISVQTEWRLLSFLHILTILKLPREVMDCLGNAC